MKEFRQNSEFHCLKGFYFIILFLFIFSLPFILMTGSQHTHLVVVLTQLSHDLVLGHKHTVGITGIPNGSAARIMLSKWGSARTQTQSHF